MLKNTTFNLPEELMARAKAYAANHGTTVTAIIRGHLEAVTSTASHGSTEGPLTAYSAGRLSRNEAIRQLGLRDYAQLLIALGDADLPIPRPPAHELENQAATFVGLWRQS